MIVQQQKSYKVLLVGDSCLDIYHYGVCERISPEAPIPIFKEMRQEIKLGMSSNVKLNLESFGIDTYHLHNIEKIQKHRFIETSYNQQLFRYDEGESVSVLPMKYHHDSSVKYDAVVVSDYNKGYITSKSFNCLKETIDSSVPIFVDSKKTDLTIFKNCILKINEKEYSRSIISPEQEFVVTLGSKGALWRDKIFKTDKVDVFDVCGAGDVFLSALVYGYLKYGDMMPSIKLANKAASLSVTKIGTYVLTREEVDGLCF